MKCPYCEWRHGNVNRMTVHILSHEKQQQRTKDRAKRRRKQRRDTKLDRTS